MTCSKMTLFKGIGICYFVLTSYYEPPFVWISIESFLVAYFFFIAGYYFKPTYGYRGKWNFIKEKAELYMLLYFVYNIVFAFVRTLVKLYLKTEIMGPYPTFFNFFIEPLVEKRIYPLSGSTWFYPQLFFTYVIAQLIYYNKKESVYMDIMYLIGTAILFTMAIELGYFKNHYPILQVVLTRTLFSLVFLFLGYIYRQYIEPKQDTRLFTSVRWLIACILLLWVINLHPDIKYNYVKADFHQHPFWVPLTIGCLSIYIHLFLCDALGQILDENDLLCTVAKESYHIMFLHGISFTIINLIVLKDFLNMDNNVLDISYRYKPSLTWPFYFIAGIQLPIGFVRCARLLKQLLQQ